MMHRASVLILTLSATTLSLASSSFEGNQLLEYQGQHPYLQHHQPQNQLVPSTNIFTPPWLAQRRSRHLTNSGTASNMYALYPQPQLYNAYNQQQQTAYLQPTHSYSRSGASPMYTYFQTQQQQPLYHQTFEGMPFAHHQRPVTTYYPPAPSTVYLAPVVSSDHHFAKRVDSSQQSHFLKPTLSGESKHKQPCSTASATLPSDQYPVYVLPPKNFQPIIYHHQQVHPLVSTKSAEELWYEKADNSGKVKYGSGKHDNTENAIEPGKPLTNEYRKIYLVPVSPEQINSGGHSFPVYEAVIREVAAPADSARKNVPLTNSFNSQIEVRPHSQQQNTPESGKPDQRRLKTKLPVGLTSFFLGGIRGVSGRHWAMPAELVKDLEFMPNLSPMSPENKYLPEESYVKKVDNGGEPAAAGDPEKEDTPASKTIQDAKKVFEGANTIIDSPHDLETAESSSSSKQELMASQPASSPSASSVSAPKS